jgi:hypothetical protein
MENNNRETSQTGKSLEVPVIENRQKEKELVDDIKKADPEDEAEKIQAEKTEATADNEKKEKSAEQKEREVVSVSDFIDYLENKALYLEDNDNAMKTKLAMQIMKISHSLSAAGLSPDEVKVDKMPSGTLGLFNKKTGDIIFSYDLLEDLNSQEIDFKTVATHEKVHSEGILDESLAHILTKRKLSGANEAYTEEQAKARTAFYRFGVSQAIELYDLRNPEDLFNKYIKIGLKYRYEHKKGELNRFLGEGNFVTKYIKNWYLSKETSKINDEMIKKIREAVPNLYNAEKNRVDLTKNIKLALQELALENK